MSKQDNLKEYLTDLYEGISSKKPGASRNPQNFRGEIESIVTGGGASLAEFDGVCKVTGTPTEEDHIETLYEYDGKCKVSGEPAEDIPDGEFLEEYDGKYTITGTPTTDEGGLAINGIIREYKVNAGATVNAGDFVEFVNKFGSGEFSSVPSNSVAACKLDNDRILIAFADETNSRAGMAVVLKISNNSINVGEPYMFTSTSENAGNYGASYISVDTIDSTRVFIAYNTKSQYIHTSILKIDDCEISGKIGGYSTDADTDDSYTSVAVFSDSLMAVSYSRDSVATSKHYVYFWLFVYDKEVERLNLLGTYVIDENSDFHLRSHINKLSEAKALLSYTYAGQIICRVVSVSKTGASIGSKYIIDSSAYNSSIYPTAMDIMSSEVAILSVNIVTSSRACAYLLDINGNAVTKSFETYASGYQSGLVKLSEDSALWAYTYDGKICVRLMSVTSEGVLAKGALEISDVLLTSDTYSINIIALSETNAVIIANNGSGFYREVVIEGSELVLRENTDYTSGTFVQPATSNLHNVGVAATSGSEGETVEVYCAV